jgi:hypothetical protein
MQTRFSNEEINTKNSLYFKQVLQHTELTQVQLTSSRSSTPSETMLTLVIAESWTWSWWCPTSQESKLKIRHEVNNALSACKIQVDEISLSPQFEIYLSPFLHHKIWLRIHTDKMQDIRHQSMNFTMFISMVTMACLLAFLQLDFSLYPVFNYPD